MVLVSDPVMLINLILCIVILVLGYLVYRKREKYYALLIGFAFGLFGLTHLDVLLGLSLFSDITFALLMLCCTNDRMIED